VPPSCKEITKGGRIRHDKRKKDMKNTENSSKSESYQDIPIRDLKETE
jgi:hypothetical protein